MGPYGKMLYDFMVQVLDIQKDAAMQDAELLKRARGYSDVDLELEDEGLAGKDVEDYT